MRAVAQIVSEPSEPGGYLEGEWQDIDLLGCIFPEGGQKSNLGVPNL